MLNSVATQHVFSLWTGVTAPHSTAVTFVFSRKIQMAHRLHETNKTEDVSSTETERARGRLLNVH